MMIRWFVPGNFPATTGAIVFDTRLAEALRAAGDVVEITPLPGMHPLADAEAEEAASRAAQGLAPDADGPIVIDGFCLYAFAAEAERLTAAIAILHHPMSAEPHLAEDERARFHAIESALLPRLAHIVVPSEAVRQQIITTHGLAAERVTLLAPGVPDAPRSAGSGGPGCHLLAVASLIPRKGYETVLRALQRLPDLDWRLTICGDASIDASHAATLHALAEEPGLAGRVRFLGPQTTDEMEALWQSADVFVSGSRFEGYGMAVAEAVRHGLPLAITKTAAAPELIPQQGSALVHPGDDVQLSKALRRLIFDPSARAVMAQTSWEAGQSLPNWTDQARHFRLLLAGARAA